MIRTLIGVVVADNDNFTFSQTVSDFLPIGETLTDVIGNISTETGGVASNGITSDGFSPPVGTFGGGMTAVTIQPIGVNVPLCAQGA